MHDVQNVVNALLAIRRAEVPGVRADKSAVCVWRVVRAGLVDEVLVNDSKMSSTRLRPS